MNVSHKDSSQMELRDNANRMYTAEEDQEILEHWWDKKARPDLCHRLGRTKAAVAQRFYAIIRDRGIDPKQYRQEMREKAKNTAPPRNNAVTVAPEWTTQTEMRLWRLVKTGLSLEEISGELGRSVSECMDKLNELREKNQDPGDPGARQLGEKFFSDPEAADPASVFALPELKEAPLTVNSSEQTPQTLQAQPNQEPLGDTDELETSNGEDDQAPAEDVDSDDDILEALKNFPKQIREMDGRMNQLENECHMLRENLEFVLEELSAGISRTGGLLAGHKEEFTTYQRLKQENSELRRQMEQMQERVEEEKRELRKTYQEVDFWLGEFLKMRKIEKVASLSDLIPKLKYSYDRFGVLLNVARD